MAFEWSPGKGRANQRKHGVSFELAREVFDDPLVLSRFDRVVGGEERWHSLGMVRNDIVLIVAHTVVESDGEETIRIISARKATRRERLIYEETKR